MALTGIRITSPIAVLAGICVDVGQRQGGFLVESTTGTELIVQASQARQWQQGCLHWVLCRHRPLCRLAVSVFGQVLNGLLERDMAARTSVDSIHQIIDRRTVALPIEFRSQMWLKRSALVVELPARSHVRLVELVLTRRSRQARQDRGAHCHYSSQSCQPDTSNPLGHSQHVPAEVCDSARDLRLCFASHSVVLRIHQTERVSNTVDTAGCGL